MRILIVCPYEWNRPGGVKTHIVDSAKSLMKLGHQVVVVSPVGGTPELPVGWESLISSSPVSGSGALFPVNAGRTIQFGGTQIDITWMGGSAKDTILCFLKAYSPDVIHFHTPWTPFFSIQLLQIATELRNNNVIHTRFVATFHDTPSKSGLGRILGAYIMPIVARYFMRAFDKVVAVSEPQSRYLSRFTSQKVHVIPNGIHISNLSNFKFNASKYHQYDPYILFLGRLERRKGVIDAIEVFRIVSTRIEHLKMIIAGDGPLRQQAEDLVNDYDLKNVLFTGHVSESEKWELIAQAKLYLAPALYGESFGIVLLEAMSVGTPVAGYANEGYKSVITGVFDDMFVQPGDFKKLADIISERIKNDKKLRTDSKKALELARNYSWDVVIKALIPLYT